MTTSTTDVRPRCHFHSFRQFTAEAERMLQQHPERTRCGVNYRHQRGTLRLRVTNQDRCIKYYTELATDVEKFQELSRRLAHVWMYGVPLDEVQASSGEAVPVPLGVAQGHVSKKKQQKRKGNR